jgi:predicted amidophosphoribosyltransferase
MQYCQACKAEWQDDSPYCTECGFHICSQAGTSTQVRVNQRTRQIIELERERDEALTQFKEARRLLKRLLESYEDASSGAGAWTDSSFDADISDIYKFLRENSGYP